MPHNIHIRKGLDIPIGGVAEKRIEKLDAQRHALYPRDYVGVEPIMMVEEGANVKAGEELFRDKRNEAARFVATVSGKVMEIARGEKRAVEAVVVESDRCYQSDPIEWLSRKSVGELARDQIVEILIETGLWTTLKQRPYGIIPSRESHPKALFISGFDSSPIAVDRGYLIEGREQDFQMGIEVLRKLVAVIHLSLRKGQKSVFEQVAGVEVHYINGPHPAGLVGTQIAHIDPINKGEEVWTIGVQDVANIGATFRTGEYCSRWRFAFCGEGVENPHYWDTYKGASVAELSKRVGEGNWRLISGDVLSGTQIMSDGFIGGDDEKVSVVREGDEYDFLGWLRPNVHKYSISRTFLSGIKGRRERVGKCNKYQIDTGYHGARRPYFVTGTFESLVPWDIYPMQLIKACEVGDIEQMEKLGLYEVEPEDMALCEFADPSKNEIQVTIRKGLEMLRKNV